MTVEVHKVIKKTERHGFLGLQKREVEETTKRIAEYRTIGRKIRRESLLLQRGEGINGTLKVATVISPDQVQVFNWMTSSGQQPKETGNQTLSENEINEANLVSEDGEGLVWRETEPGDYPEIMPLSEFSGELVVKQS